MEFNSAFKGLTCFFNSFFQCFQYVTVGLIILQCNFNFDSLETNLLKKNGFLLWRFVSILEDRKGSFVKASKMQSGHIAEQHYYSEFAALQTVHAVPVTLDCRAVTRIRWKQRVWSTRFPLLAHGF